MKRKFNKGSIWRVWDLQVQTIIDDQYTSLSEYFEDIKRDQPDLWSAYINKVGGEAKALLFDSKEYFNDTKNPENERCLNYTRNLFSYLEIFAPNLGLIAFTDHNYHHGSLIDVLYQYSHDAFCKCLCGVEINASGVHMLVYFEKPPFNKQSFSEGIKTFLDSIGVNQPKEQGVLTVSPQSINAVIQIILEQGGLYLFPHCNSSNGLFQERGRTDRTYLANVFNSQAVTLLQASSRETADITANYIKSKKDTLVSKFVFTISSDSRKLADIGQSDNKGFFTWVKADATFHGLRQILIENERVEISDEPKLTKRVYANKTKFLQSLDINKISGSSVTDIWFKDFRIELNSGLIAVIGNKGSGKSAIADILGICGNTHQDPKNFSFLTASKFRKLKPINLAVNFDGIVTWEDGSIYTRNLNENPDKSQPERVKYIPQNFLETVCANVDSSDFERELKQIIFHHTPADKRYNKSSLDELIDYKSNLISDEILKLRLRLAKVNQDIVFLEAKSRDDYRLSIENQIKLKNDEIAAHDTIKPVQPQINAESTKQDELKRLGEQREELHTKENEAKEHRTKKTLLLVDIEELTQTSSHFVTLQSDLNKYFGDSSNYKKILDRHAIDISKVFSFSINIKPIQEKLSEKQNEVSTIDRNLDENIEGSLSQLITQLSKSIADGQETLDKPAKEQQKYLSDLKTWTDVRVGIVGDKDTEATLGYYESQLDYLRTKLPTELQILYSQRLQIVSELYSNKQKLVEIRKELFQPVSRFIEEYKELKDRYDVKFDVSLDLKSFSDNFFSFINQGRIGSFTGREEGFKRLTELTENSSFDSVDTFTNFAQILLDNLNHDYRSKDKAPIDILTELKGGKQLNELYDFIFGYDYLQPTYNLKLGDKTLQALSPGERGALLLIFYLILDNDDIPLIIDQPEENLDNESVYHILVHFIKKVKEQRQIIIVTHNPNLAVVCDADQIIHMQIDKANGNEVHFTSGAIEDLDINKSVVNVLEGTLPAFSNRDSKYIRVTT